MEATWKGVACALVMGMLMSIGTSVSAMPTGEPGGGWNPGGGGGGEDPPPELPASGYWTVDCPSSWYAAWFMDEHVVTYNPTGINERTGPAGSMWMTAPDHYMYLRGGAFMDLTQEYGWPAQPMPLANGTIMSVYLIVLVMTPGSSFDGYLQYWDYAEGVYYPNPATNPEYYQTMDSASSYTEYLFNVTEYEAWTPGMLMNSQFGVRLYTEDFMSPANPVVVDYVGLRYNWTLNNSAPAQEEHPWDDSSFSRIESGGWIVGGMGTAGFIGMIAVPAAGYVVTRNSENRMATALKFLMVFLVCFALFLGSIMG